MELLGYEFREASAIDAERDAGGRLVTYTAYERFANPKGLRLNRYGRGPFVRLVVDSLPRRPGVYAIASDGDVVYVGIAVDLAARWGRRGYAVIDPRNCYVGGQATNCHVNGRIAAELAAGNRLSLWVHEVAEPKPVEAGLIRALRPRWNIQGV